MAESSRIKDRILDSCFEVLHDNPSEIFSISGLAGIVAKRAFKDGGPRVEENVRKRIHELEKEGRFAGIADKCPGVVTVESKRGAYERRIVGLRLVGVRESPDSEAFAKQRMEDMAKANGFFLEAGRLKDEGRMPEAIENFVKAKTIYSGIAARGGLEEKFHAAHYVIALGYAYLAAKKPSEALRSFREAIEIHRRNQPRFLPDYSWAIQGLGCGYLLRRRNAIAVRWLAEALGMRRVLVHQNERWWQALASNLNALANALELMGQIDEARERYEDRLASLRMLDKTTSTLILDTAETHLNIARIELRAKDNAECRRHLDRARELLAKQPDPSTGVDKLEKKALHKSLDEIEGAMNKGLPAPDLPTNFRIFPFGY